MTNQELLIGFIDDKLDYRQEQEFLRIAARDSALRSSLKQYLKIERTSSAVAIDAFPSPESTFNVFNSLGFEYLAAGAAVVPGAFNKLALFVKSKSSLILSAGAGALITAAILISTYAVIIKDKSNDTINSNLAENSKIYYEEVDRSGLGSGTHKPAAIEKIVYKNVYVLPKELKEELEEKAAVNIEDQEIVRIANISESPILLSANFKNFNKSLINEDLMQEPAFTFFRQNYKSSSESNIILEFRGSEYFFKDVPEIEPKKYARLNNNAIAAYYKINDNWHAGIDVRQETFYLIYTGSEGDKLYEYKMQPNFTSFSISAGYMNKLWGPVNYMLRAYGGANYYGTLGRVSLGFEYELLPNLAIILNGDYNYMWFSHQGNDFNTSKYGLNYGLSFKF